MSNHDAIGLLLILINVLFSYQGFKDDTFFTQFKFSIDGILNRKEYVRLITSGFLHVSWMHLIFNMLSLYVFSGMLEQNLGIVNFLIVYLSSLIGGNLLSLVIHRNHDDYHAVGASGAVCGVIFASIALFPHVDIGLFGIPYGIPGWAYGLLFIGYSIYGIKSQSDNIGHESHLGGALVGMIAAIAIQPIVLRENYATILLIIVPTAAFIYLVVTRPHVLMVDNLFYKNNKKYHNLDEKYNTLKIESEERVNQLLEKINEKGIDSLTMQEKKVLDDYAKKIT